MGLIPNGALKQAESCPAAEFTSFVKSASRYIHGSAIIR